MSKLKCIDCGVEWSSAYAAYVHVCNGRHEYKEKFTLTFDEPPALVFVQERGSNKVQVYQDGKVLKGVRSIAINAYADDVTTHTVEYITGHTDMK